MADGAVGGFGTRIYFIPNAGADTKSSQILKGSGYVTINLKGAHYRSEGNLWQKIFGGSDKVTLATQITHSSSSATVATASIEEMRQIEVGKPFYFGSNRPVPTELPTDCNTIGVSITISAVKSDNLSGALEILNSGELKSTLQLAPPMLSGSLAVPGIVKKLLTNTDPQNSLQGEYDGRLSLSASDNPIRDFCLAQGTIILIYRESEDDTSLDDLEPAKLTTDGDGLKYDGNTLLNTYTMFQISFEPLRGDDPSSTWYGILSSADQSLEAVAEAANDSEKQKIWSAAFAMYQQAEKLLLADPTYTQYEAKGLAASHLIALQAKYASLSGQPKPAAPNTLLFLSHNIQTADDLEKVAQEYSARLVRANVTLPGPLKK